MEYILARKCTCVRACVGVGVCVVCLAPVFHRLATNVKIIYCTFRMGAVVASWMTLPFWCVWFLSCVRLKQDSDAVNVDSSAPTWMHFDRQWTWTWTIEWITGLMTIIIIYAILFDSSAPPVHFRRTPIRACSENDTSAIATIRLKLDEFMSSQYTRCWRLNIMCIRRVSPSPFRIE